MGRPLTRSTPRPRILSIRIQKEGELTKSPWLPGLALAVLVLSAVASAPAMTAAADAPQLQKTATAKIPHKIVPIIETVVQADLTAKELLFENHAPARPLVLKLFKDFQRVSVATYLYANKLHKVPLDPLSVYFVSISSPEGIQAVLFQVIEDKVHIIKVD